MYPEYKGSICGPAVPMNPVNYTSLHYLKMLWPDHLVDVLVVETNRYALGKGGNWTPVGRDDIWAFLGIVILMGIHRLPSMDNYWSSDPLLAVKHVARCMSQHRFMSIWCNLHVVDNNRRLPAGASLSDKLGDVLNVLAEMFATSYLPGQELGVDESIIKYKGVVKKGRVSMPKKPIKKGFKIWCRLHRPLTREHTHSARPPRLNEPGWEDTPS